MKTFPCPCPCGEPAAYADCCEPLNTGSAAAVSPMSLMRSRYSAYVLQLEPYLLATWHPDTRPDALDLASQQPSPTWLGLDVRAEHMQDPDHATVEFVARYWVGGERAQRLHEISRFVREDDRWLYLDGELKPDA